MSDWEVLFKFLIHILKIFRSGKLSEVEGGGIL